MSADDLVFRQALGSCGTDIVGIQNLKHVGSGLPHQASDTDNGKGGNGQHQMCR